MEQPWIIVAILIYIVGIVITATIMDKTNYLEDLEEYTVPMSFFWPLWLINIIIEKAIEILRRK